MCRPLVGINVLINPVVADALVLLQLEPPTDLFWTPLLQQERLDARPGCALDAWPVRAQLASARQFLRLAWAITALPAVARKFARDGGLVAADD